MSELENRLHAAMQTFAAEPPPAGLLDGVRRRHRRHLARLAAACAVAVLTVAVGAQPVAHALLAAPAHPASAGQLDHQPTRHGQAAAPAAAPGTVLSGCASANVGSIGAHWSSGTMVRRLAGQTLWFISEGSGRARGLTLYPGVMVLNGARPGTTVIVEVARSGLGLLRFLYGPDDAIDPGPSYTMRSGENGVTFVACPGGSGPAPEPPGVTIYYGAFLVRADRCVPVDVWLPGRQTPVSASLGNCR